ncbi:MAG: peptide ABC transporter ATP-binding protein [Rhizobiales bacterium]|nr:peptide ABC transporter ATP-binding protein [Hyphomicrobiales bacterium]
MNDLASTTPLLRVTDLSKHFGGKGGYALRAVDGVDLEINAGETVGVVGESGCGKSTLGRTIIRIYEPTSGSVQFARDGEMVDISTLKNRALMPFRREMSMVFQDPVSSLNPRKPIRFSIGEPLRLMEGLRGRKLTERVGQLLEAVGLPERSMERYPHAFSGGQRQRIALARAIALNPRLVIADEAVSALDVSVQAQIVNLFLNLQRERDLSFLFISHDLKIVRHVSDRIIVMYLGKIVEEGPAYRVCASPQHPYTEALLSAVPGHHAATGRSRIVLKGDPPNPANPPSGCHFRPRCAHATDLCASQKPLLRPVPGKPGRVACHHAEKLNLTGA